MMKNTKENKSALDAFLAKKLEIYAALKRLKDLSDDNFETNPDKITWGHVGNLELYAELLKQITDSAFNEGECAI